MSGPDNQPAEQALQTLLSEVKPALRPYFTQLLAGEISAQIALMYLLLQTRNVAELGILVQALLRGAAELPALAAVHTGRLAHLAQLIIENEAGCERIAQMLRSGVDTDEPAASVEDGIAFCKRLFDWSVQQNPEASVALYSLGNPQILAAATGEIVARMGDWGLLRAHSRALEIGCGIGRFQVALADQLGHITGIDVSEKMIAAARVRCAGLANVRLLECSGYDLGLFPARQFDLVFAVDSFPYLCQSGMALVKTHFREVARVLRPGGDFLLLNFSYRCDLDADRADVAQLAAVAGFEVIANGTQEFALWDGVTFRLRLRD